MKILITSHGTRGDVQPYLALAVGLQHAGHQVTLATSHAYADWIQGYGVQAHPTRFNVQEFTLHPETLAALKSRNPVRVIGRMRQLIQLGAEAMDEVWAAIQHADFIIDTPTSTGALDAAQQRNVPAAHAYPVPFAPTRAFPSFFLGQPRFSLGAGYNLLTHSLMHKILWSGMSGPLSNPLRKKLGQKAWGSFANQRAYAKRMGIPSLYGFSAHVLPKPADWDELQHITGYWFLDSPPNWQPPAEVQQFLESGPPPVYVGYGSINIGDSEQKTRLILRALEMNGQRGVISTGWGGLTRQPAPPSVLFVENIPHDWLFPRMAAVVHHGGAGTTGASLRSGVPTLITPFAGDQASWGERVVQLGVGPRAIGLKQLTAEKLAEAIQVMLTDATLRARAAALGEKIRAEHGVARAVEIIERHAAQFKQKKGEYGNYLA